MDIKDKVVLVAGGGSGLGQATCQHFAELGATIAVLDRNIEQAKAVAETVDGLACCADVTDEAAVQTAINDVVATHEAVHVLVNCAGICPAQRVLGRDGVASLDLFAKTVQVNLVGTFNVLRLTAAVMAKQAPVSVDGARGVIINTASIAAYEGQVGQAAYSASKAGVVGMTLPIAREFKRFGVRVMTIAPGVFATPMMSGLSDDVSEQLAAEVPFPSRLGQAEEYAQLAAHIVSNPYLNGNVIRLDAALRLS